MLTRDQLQRAAGVSGYPVDTLELLASDAFEHDKLRLAFVVHGGINRVDWRAVSAGAVTTTVADVKRQLLPMLRQDIRPAATDVGRWTDELINMAKANKKRGASSRQVGISEPQKGSAGKTPEARQGRVTAPVSCRGVSSGSRTAHQVLDSQ